MGKSWLSWERRCSPEQSTWIMMGKSYHENSIVKAGEAEGTKYFTPDLHKMFRFSHQFSSEADEPSVLSSLCEKPLWTKTFWHYTHTALLLVFCLGYVLKHLHPVLSKLVANHFILPNFHLKISLFENWSQGSIGNSSCFSMLPSAATVAHSCVLIEEYNVHTLYCISAFGMGNTCWKDHFIVWCYPYLMSYPPCPWQLILVPRILIPAPSAL